MRVIIVGCGKVGYAIAKDLSEENDTDVTVVDEDEQVLEKILDSLDVIGIKGSGLNSNILMSAGAKDADLIICVTHSDEMNILCAVSAKRLGVKNTVARVRNPEYGTELNNFWQSLGLDMIVNPERETAREISRLFRFPAVDGIDTFMNGRVELVSFSVDEAPDFFDGKSVAQIFRKKSLNILLTMVERGGETIIPNGDFVFEKQDIISVLGRPAFLMDFLTLTGSKKTEKIKNAAIIGGGKISYYLLELLSRHTSGMNLKVIETDKARCELLSESFPKCTVINGDGTDGEILDSEIAGYADATACLTDRDEQNTIIALYSMHLKTRKTIVKINHIDKDLVKRLGLGSIVSTENITSEQIIRHVRRLSGVKGGDISAVYKMFKNGGNEAEAIEFEVHEGYKCLNTPIRDLKIEKEVLIGCIARSSNIIIPDGDSMIKAGDRVVIIAKNGNIVSLDDILKS
jgi:trk system potassium uptake protein TrkA